jgi:predicted secreted protein
MDRGVHVMRVLGDEHRSDDVRATPDVAAARLVVSRLLGGRPRARTPTVQQLQDRLRDARGKKVAFVSHCLLNQNVRYLGGATRPAMIDAVVDDLRRRDIGVVQMPCPEVDAWGGVLKRRMLRLYGSGLARSRVGRALVAPVARCWTVLRYRRLARRIAGDIADYIDAGFEVTEIIGVGPSPSCGVSTTVDLAAAVVSMAQCDPTTITRDTVNTLVVKANTTPGRGLFMDALLARLSARRLTVPVRQHDLLAGLDLAARSPVDAAACLDSNVRRVNDP